MTKLIGGKSCSTCAYVKVNPDKSMHCQESPPQVQALIILTAQGPQVAASFGFQPPVNENTVCGRWKVQILNG